MYVEGHLQGFLSVTDFWGILSRWGSCVLDVLDDFE